MTSRSQGGASRRPVSRASALRARAAIGAGLGLVLLFAGACGEGDTGEPRYTNLKVPLTVRFVLDTTGLPDRIKGLVEESDFVGLIDTTIHTRWPPWSQFSQAARIAGTTVPATISLRRPLEVVFPVLEQALFPSRGEPRPQPDQVWFLTAYKPRSSTEPRKAAQSLGVTADEAVNTGPCRLGCRYDDDGVCKPGNECDPLIDQLCSATCEQPEAGRGVPVLYIGGKPRKLPRITIRINAAVATGTSK